MRKTKRPLYPIVLALKERRIKQGLLQEDLAKKLGYSPSAIKGWEYGRHVPRFRSLHDLVEALGGTLKVEWNDE